MPIENEDGQRVVRRADALPCRFELLDRHIFPAGVIPGQQILLAGDPGSGKSTLMLQALLGFSREGVRCIYFASEEKRAETIKRLEQLRLNEGRLRVEVVEARSTEDVFDYPLTVSALGPVQVVIVDSLQGLGLSPNLRAEWEDLYVFMAKLRAAQIAAFYVAHVTKDEKIAGPKDTEHGVDTVVLFSPAMTHRLIRVPKNRRGPALEQPVLCRKDPVGRLSVMARSTTAVVGRATAFDDGGLVEVEAKVEFAASFPRQPRRPALNGVTKNAYAKVVSVLRGVGIDLGPLTVTCSILGGRRYQPEQDLAIAMALLASYMQTSLPWEPVYCAELTLGGELLEAPVTLLRRLVRDYKKDDFPAGSRVFVFERASRHFIWKELVPHSLLPLGAMDFKALPEVAFEFLLSRELPAGWRPE